MDERISGDFRTLTVLRTWPSGTASGATALVFDTKEAGPIAFEIDLRSIEILQKQLAQCAALLVQKPGMS